MTRITVRSRLSDDGILRLTLPVGVDEANKEVQVTVEPVTSPIMSEEEWRDFVLRTAGSISDPSFFRHEQGLYEEREPLP